MDKRAAKLIEHFNDVRSAVLAGEFDSIPELDVPLTGFNESDLVAIQAAATRTNRILAAAMRGMKESQDKIRHSNTIRQSFSSYGANGEVANHLTYNNKIQRKV